MRLFLMFSASVWSSDICSYWITADPLLARLLEVHCSNLEDAAIYVHFPPFTTIILHLRV
jgi:hypothetical protein